MAHAGVSSLRRDRPAAVCALKPARAFGSHRLRFSDQRLRDHDCAFRQHFGFGHSIFGLGHSIFISFGYSIFGLGPYVFIAPGDFISDLGYFVPDVIDFSGCPWRHRPRIFGDGGRS